MFVRGLHWGQGEREGSLAEKALFSSIFGNRTQKTFARIYNLLIGEDVPGPGIPRIVDVPLQKLFTLEISRVSPISMADFRVSRKRGKSLFKFIYSELINYN